MGANSPSFQLLLLGLVPHTRWFPKLSWLRLRLSGATVTDEVFGQRQPTSVATK
jgi:hypothetical protein